MSRLAELIEETKDARELKRALSVKMGQSGMAAGASRGTAPGDAPVCEEVARALRVGGSRGVTDGLSRK